MVKKAHPADKPRKVRLVVYIAMSKKLFYYREHISKLVLKQGCVPLNPFMIFNYYLLDTIPRRAVREANNNLVCIADELWVFGEISDGVASEIRYAKKLGKPIRYFDVSGLPKRIKEIKEGEVKYED